MSRMPYAGVVHYGCFPRVSGDEPGAGIQVIAHAWFSPRERG